MRITAHLAALLIIISSCKNTSTKTDTNNDSILADSSQVEEPKKEKHIANLRQLTWGGDNAEAYFSFDNKKLIFQSQNPDWGLECDQIFLFTIDSMLQDTTMRPQLISTGRGRTTCSYFMEGDTQIIYASTHLKYDKCPPVPERHKDGKYLWAIYPEFDIFIADLEGNIKKQLTTTVGYDAEATISPDGKSIVFTSTRSGDLELFTMNTDGTNVKQITSELGYDGGAFFSPDGTKLVFRASRPKKEQEVKEYKELLAQGLVAPINMEIYVCNVDGSDMKQVTQLGNANWAPFFHPNGEKIIFSSNHHSNKGYDFQLYMINIDGTGLEQITTTSMFNAFPMFSPDGKKLIFSSNRNNGGTHGTNLFIADWIN